MHGGEKIVFFSRQHIIAHGHAGGDKLYDATFYKFFSELRVFELFADSHTLAGAYELRQIAVERVMRKAGEFDELSRAVGATCERYAEDFRCLDCIFGEGFIKVADTEKEHCVGMLCLHLGVLLHQRCFNFLAT